jgi:hypothetical protein
MSNPKETSREHIMLRELYGGIHIIDRFIEEIAKD